MPKHDISWRFDEGNILAVYAFRGLCSCVALQDFIVLQCSSVAGEMGQPKSGRSDT